MVREEVLGCAEAARRELLQRLQLLLAPEHLRFVPRHRPPPILLRIPMARKVDLLVVAQPAEAPLFEHADQRVVVLAVQEPEQVRHDHVRRLREHPDLVAGCSVFWARHRRSSFRLSCGSAHRGQDVPTRGLDRRLTGFTRRSRPPRGIAALAAVVQTRPTCLRLGHAVAADGTGANPFDALGAGRPSVSQTW